MEWGEKLFAGAIVWGLLVLTAFLAGDKNVRGYYLGNANERNLGYCVSADINWVADPVVFCSDDIRKTVATYERLQGGR